MNLTPSDRRELVVWVVTNGRHGWSKDGPHSEDTDLTRTYQILNRISRPTVVLKVTIKDNERYGYANPEIEDVTVEALGSGKAESLPGGPF